MRCMYKYVWFNLLALEQACETFVDVTMHLYSTPYTFTTCFNTRTIVCGVEVYVRVYYMYYIARIIMRLINGGGGQYVDD